MKEDKQSIDKLVKKVLSIFHIKVSKKTENLLIQIFKFGIVGVIATVIDFGFLYIFKEFAHINTIIANTLSFCISVIYNYIASVKWVFNVNKEKNPKKNFILFIVFSVIGLILNDAIMWVCTDKLNIHYLIAKVIATALVMIFNFVTRKKFLE